MIDNQTLPSCEPTSIRLACQSNPPERILMVEDDQSIRRLNTEVLLRLGYDVDGAEDGAAAWEALGADDYDLMITDNTMPRLSGVELLKKLHAAHMELPVIMATGTLPQAEFTRHPWLQPAATLLKPYTVEELCRTVKKVLREAEDSVGSSQPFLNAALKKNPPPALAASAPTPLPFPPHPAHRILVVDEDRDLRRLYTEALAGPGYQVDAAADGAAGWNALQANPYHLLITEHDLPQLTGVELVKKARAAHMGLPVVMAAARMPTAELARTPSLQLAATLNKPFAVDTLLHTVKNILRATVMPLEQITPLLNWRQSPFTGGWRI